MIATTQKKENESFIEELKDLLCLDYAAADAYEAVIERISNETYKSKLEEFKDDHLTHIENITTFFKRGGHDYPTSAGMKKILTQGKVVLANLIGDATLLKAMKSNEQQTTQSYEHINKYNEIPEGIRGALLKGYEDEKKHLSWIEQELEIKIAEKKW